MSGNLDNARLVYLALLGAALAAGLLFRYRGRLGQATQHAAIWLLIILGVVVLYGFRDVLRGELFPGEAMRAGSGEITLRRSADGHFHADVNVDGVEIPFLVDTGASTVVLTQDDARRIGINPDRLDYTLPATTANGTVMGAPVTLSRVEFGGYVDHDIAAIVNGGELSVSLLGMSYLNRYARVSFEGDRLLLSR